MIHRAIFVATCATAALAACAPAPPVCSAGRSVAECSFDASPARVDGGQPLPPRPEDSGQLSPPPPLDGGECEATEAERWAGAHRTTALVDALRACSIDPCWAGDECALSSCTAAAVGLASCEGCVARELDCLLRECRDPCGAGGGPSACLICACGTGCAANFDECAGAPAIACTPCESVGTCPLCSEPGGCRPGLLSPALLVAAAL